jgi:hypothetical protein
MRGGFDFKLKIPKIYPKVDMTDPDNVKPK